MISRPVVTARGLSDWAAATLLGKHSSFSLFQAKPENLEEITQLSTFPFPSPEDAGATLQSQRRWEAAACCPKAQLPAPALQGEKDLPQ